MSTRVALWPAMVSRGVRRSRCVGVSLEGSERAREQVERSGGASGAAERASEGKRTLVCGLFLTQKDVGRSHGS